MRWPASGAREIPGDTLHVWAAALDAPSDRLDILEATLSPEERERASRYRSAEVSLRSIAARGILRELLGTYLAVEPRTVALTVDELGKPKLAGGTGPRTLQFNVTHSGGLGLYAMALGRCVGIDVEPVARGREISAGALRFLSPNERAALAEIPAADQALAVSSIWTRKEAFLKARGTGLRTPLNSFDVSVGPDEPARLLRVASEPDAPGRWLLVHLQPADGFVGAVAVDDPSCRIDCRWWCP